MSLVCLDTNILVWGIKKTASPGQEHMVQWAVNFLEWLDENKKKIIIPVPIVSELLVPIPDHEHEKFLALLNEKFRVVPVDVVAAVKTAQIWSSKKDNEELKRYRDENRISRESMKFDFQIASVAITRKAECIYSHDPHIKKFVGDLISVREMPDIGKQGMLEL